MIKSDIMPNGDDYRGKLHCGEICRDMPGKRETIQRQIIKGNKREAPRPRGPEAHAFGKAKV